MLRRLLERESCEDINYIETTVTQSNIPSQKLFHGLARDLGTKIKVSECFTSEDFPEKGHEDELIHEIGPFKIRKLLLGGYIFMTVLVEGQLIEVYEKL